MADVLALFADCVNAYRGGNPEEIEAVNAIWDSAVPKHVWTWEDNAEGDDDEATRPITDGECDLVADAYERRLGL